MKTPPVSRFVTTRSRSFTSLRPAAGLPGGSVQTRVTRNGWDCPLVESERMRVWLWPVARAFVGFWSKKRIEHPLGLKLESAAGMLFGRLIRPQPCELVGLRT